MKKISLLICTLLITACTSQTQVMVNQPTPTISDTAASPTSNTSEETDHVYDTKDFSFTYLPEYSIQSDTDTEVIWQAEFNPGEVRENELFLKIQKKPFAEIKEGTEVKIANYQGSVEGVDEQTSITVDNKQMKKYSYGCGVDCYYSTVQFQAGTNYYELTQNVAGGGLSHRFDTMVNSIKFK